MGWRVINRVTSSTTDKDKKSMENLYLVWSLAVQRQEVWRPALFFYLQDQYKEEATKIRAETVTSLYNQWKELSLEQKQPYLDQSNAITKQISEIRASFPFSCYCALFKLFEQKKNPSLDIFDCMMNRIESSRIECNHEERIWWSISSW